MKLADHKRDLGRCTYCPKLCRFCCPTAEAEHRETVTPWFKMSLAERMRSGRFVPDEEFAEVFYHCFGCLHCRTHCNHEVDVPGALYQARADCLQAGAAPEPVQALLADMEDSGNPFGEQDLGQRLREAVDAHYFQPEAQAVIFPGCQAIRESQRHLAPLMELLEAVGVDYVGVHTGEQLCCGAPLWQAGDFSAFRAHARALRRELSRARTVICPCPTCAVVLGQIFAQFDTPLSAKVLSLDAFLGPILDERGPNRKVAGSFSLQDPCALSRYMEHSRELRELIAPALEEPLREAHGHSEDAGCCGGGGLVPFVLPDLAQAGASLRCADLKKSGAETIITACPSCLRQLQGAADGQIDFCTIEELLLESYR